MSQGIGVQSGRVAELLPATNEKPLVIPGIPAHQRHETTIITEPVVLAVSG
jgi:hypothetical protein